MENIWIAKEKDPDGSIGFQARGRTDLATQATISIALGLSAFLTFCFLRPRWTALYAARKKQNDAASSLPELPKTLFGWIAVLYKITEEEVLASAGLDAFVFLAFFKMAIKYLLFVLFFSLTVIYPVNLYHDPSDHLIDPHKGKNGTNSSLPQSFPSGNAHGPVDISAAEGSYYDFDISTDYLWVYVIFVYLFSIVAMYMIIQETKRMIRVRQTYMGTHSSITDRTIRLSGIPPHLQTEDKIKETIEGLGIGKVESVTLCRVWKELDDLMAERTAILRKLEEALTVHVGYHKREQRLKASLHSHEHELEDHDTENERSGLLGANTNEQEPGTKDAGVRPKTRLWFGFWKLKSKKVDAIDYFEEKLRQLDAKIKDARQKKYPPTSLAFVTLDSIAACQMAAQAILDPVPMQLKASAAPAPIDVVWRNTYLSRRKRVSRAWLVTFVIAILSVVWLLFFAPIAVLLNPETIRKVSKPFGDLLDRHEILRSLVTSFLPTLFLSLLNVVAPYLYEWLSNRQGMTSQADIELSIISKNFFFTLFNFFLVFTIFGTASNIYNAAKIIGERIKDLDHWAKLVAGSLSDLTDVYVNLIVLQGIGLFPFRLLEFGAVSMYPFYLFGAKTPRDYSELVQPPVFSYGFFLPQTLFIFIICIVYSILPSSELITLFGLIYFIMGSFVYKYQLLYAMDHRQHSTGRQWSIICNRIIVGLIIFQLAMGCQLALYSAIKRAVLILPLIVATNWFGMFYRRTYNPLMKYIALRSLHQEDDELFESRDEFLVPEGTGVRESDDTGPGFINPNLIEPLKGVWLSKQPANGHGHSGTVDGEENV